MLKTFGDIKKHVKLTANRVAVVDNTTFRLHYRATFLLLIGATILVSSRQYIGEHIRCIAAKELANVIETYCFFTTTFTVVRHLNDTLLLSEAIPHGGIGPYVDGDPVIVHAYYQWVPFVLFLQALMFYLPHLIWKNLEGGRILALVKGFENSAMALHESSLDVNGKKVPSKAEYEGKVGKVRRAFLDHINLNKFWAAGLIGCELLNVANLLFQIYFTNMFLGGGFYQLGFQMIAPRHGDVMDPLDITFPKVTKCTFRKYGPTGTIQLHDALCVMALNIVNEKIYAFLWFWFVVLAIATAVSVVWRIMTMALHSRSQLFNKWVFDQVQDRHSLRTITSRCNFSDWLLLYYIGKSMNSYVFKELVKGLAFEMEEVKPRKKDRDNGDAAEQSLYDEH